MAVRCLAKACSRSLYDLDASKRKQINSMTSNDTYLRPVLGLRARKTDPRAASLARGSACAGRVTAMSLGTSASGEILRDLASMLEQCCLHPSSDSLPRSGTSFDVVGGFRQLF